MNDSAKTAHVREEIARAMCRSYFKRTGDSKSRNDANIRKRFREMADAAYAIATKSEPTP